MTSLPGKEVIATPVRADLSSDPNILNAVQGSAEITVQGAWNLSIAVDGPAGHGTVTIPLTAVAPPAIPAWMDWLIGLIPIYGVLTFLLTQGGRKEQQIIVANS